MFDSKDDALVFRDQLITELGAVDADDWQISPRLDGANIYLGNNTARVEGHLSGRGYHVEDRTNTETETDGWMGFLRVEP